MLTLVGRTFLHLRQQGIKGMMLKVSGGELEGELTSDRDSVQWKGKTLWPHEGKVQRPAKALWRLVRGQLEMSWYNGTMDPPYSSFKCPLGPTPASPSSVFPSNLPFLSSRRLFLVSAISFMPRPLQLCNLVQCFLNCVPQNVSALPENRQKNGFHTQRSLGSSAHCPFAGSFKIYQNISKGLRNPTGKPT